ANISSNNTIDFLTIRLFIDYCFVSLVSVFRGRPEIDFGAKVNRAAAELCKNCCKVYKNQSVATNVTADETSVAFAGQFWERHDIPRFP
ncbi:MAG: hypothetical protein J1D85_07855, partial [Bacteroidales bacterium]|nr:hypothetical protein [Bacteroidales bacterium]